MSRSDTQKADDLQLIAAAAQGDRDAFGRLYERYVLRVFRHTYLLTNDPQLAEDLTAQTFLNALAALPKYEMRGVPFLAWLFRIAYNLAINHKKRARNHHSHPQLLQLAQDSATLFSPADSCDARIDSQRVWQQVRRLPEQQRQVIILRFVDGLSYPDIAHILGKSVGAVRVIQHRALTNLRRFLEEDPRNPAPGRLPAEAQSPPLVTSPPRSTPGQQPLRESLPAR